MLATFIKIKKYVTLFAILLLMFPCCWCYDPSFLYDYSSQTYIADYSELYVFTIHESKQLFYLAVRHTNDIESPVCRTIQSLIKDERPDVCILEGIESCWGFNPECILNIVKGQDSPVQNGENVYASRLCYQNSIAFIGGEPSEKTYIPELAKFGITQDDVVYFMLAQQIPFWNRDQQLDIYNLKEQFESFMKKAISGWLGISCDLYTFEDFCAYHKKQTGKSYDPYQDFLWSYTSTELMPYLGENATLYQKVAARITHLRDCNIVDVIENTLQNHKKVLIIYGASHYEWQKKRLYFLFGEPSLSSVIK